jgi:hypothetical protein
MNRAASALALAGLTLLTACGTGSKTRAAPTATPAAGPTTAAVSSAPATTTPPAAPTSGSISPGAPCTAGGPIPGNAASKLIPDVDGDGKADTGFIYARGNVSPVIGVHTAAGGTFVVDFTSASGAQTRTVTFAKISTTGPVVALTDDNRQSQLFVVKGCRLEPAINPQGQHYTFDLRDFGGTGDGVTCGAVAGGVRTLVGFHYRRNAAGTKTGGETRTEILLRGLTGTGGVTATNGKSETASTTTTPDGISCGAVTEATSAIALPA